MSRKGWCSTPFGITASGTPGWYFAHISVCLCSTPFGITASGTVWPGSSTLAPECSTPFGITASGTSLFVSTTFRNPACSTPFGITASGTIPKWSPPTVWRVLNAFRHHGERDLAEGACTRGGHGVLNAFRHHGERDRRMPLGISTLRARCSTPFGITASGTTRGSTTWTRKGSAQRLSASRRAGPEHGGRSHRPPEVLNAFRHHGERDWGTRAT